MDAVPAIRVHLEHATEALSGMRLLRVTGYWDAPIQNEVPLHNLAICYDGMTATRCNFVPASTEDVPPGCVRFNFGTQLPFEPEARTLEVVLIGGSQRLRLRSFDLQAPETPTTRRSNFARRTLRSLVTGEAFSFWRWRARASRVLARFTSIARKVRGKLVVERFGPCTQHEAFVGHTVLTPRLRQAMLDAAERFLFTPTFSILVPVYNVEPRWLKAAIDSVRAQTYPHWELCLADDASTRPDLLDYLQRLPKDSRIKLVRREQNGHICRATNSAASLSTGEFVCLLDNDDLLAPHALFAIAERLQSRPDADLLYSDEDKINEGGERYDPQFKPDWSPELLLSYNYINHFTTIRRSLFEKAGQFRPGFEGSQDHDLLLRLTELTDRIEHVPQILYHWRSLPESTASSAGVKEYVHKSGRNAVKEALTRRGVSGTLFVPPFAQKLNLPVLALDGPDEGPSVALVVHGDGLERALTLDALRANTAYRPVTLTDDASKCSTEFVLFLEAGLVPRDSRWLSRLVAHLQLAGVGAVGGVIRQPDGTIVDAGPVLGLQDGIGIASAFAGTKPEPVSYYFYAEVTRNTAAVSPRCMLTRRTMIDECGILESRAELPTLWSINLGLNLRERGLRCVTVGGVEFVTLDATRTPKTITRPSELLALKREHGRLVDSFHNPNCSERTAWSQASDSPLSLPAEASTPPVRTLVIAHNLNNPEGAPRYLSEIVLGLHERGAIAPTVFSPLGGAGANVYSAAGIPVIIGANAVSGRFVDGLWTPREYDFALKAAARLLVEQRPELVIANTLTTFPLVEAAARAGIPAVWIIHESYSRVHLERLFPPFARQRIERAFALAARVVPASHDTAALFAHLNTRGNVRVIHNGLDPQPFDEYIAQHSRIERASQLGFERGKKHLIAVGTVCERKGQHTLVEAAGLLARERTDFAVHLVGLREGLPYAEYVRQLVRRRALENYIHLVPETDNVWAYYRAADLFVCTSHMETFSRAVLEAEAFGLPIVSTACCGLNEQVVWDGNALRFEAGDAAGLATQLRRVLADDSLRRSLATESRAMFDVHLNQRQMLDRYAALCLAAARQGPRANTPYVPAIRDERRAA